MTVRLTATLTTVDAYAVRDGTPAVHTELPVRRDQRGLPVMPGTALAGALRAASMRRYGEHRTIELFGSLQEQGTGQSGDQLLACSAAAVRDAAYAGEQPPTVELRPHVGIDRQRGAAKPDILFDEEVWPAGLVFGVVLEFPPADAADVAGLLEELALPTGVVGSGACRVTVSDVQLAELVTDVPALLAAAMARWDGPVDDPLVVIPQVPDPAPRTVRRDGPAWADIELAVCCVEPLASRLPIDPSSAQRERGNDNLPFAASRLRDGEQEWTVGLAADGLRGVLRTRAERALAHLGGAPVPDPWATRDAHPVARLFGWATDSSPRRSGAEQIPGGAAALLRVSDLLDRERWMPGTDRFAVEAHPAVIQRSRSSIDRLSGSTLESALFTDHVVAAGTILRGTLTVLPAPGSGLDPRDLALLAVALRDVLDGDAGVGGSSHSGYGTLALQEATLRLGYLDGERPRVEEQRISGRLDWPPGWAALICAGWEQLRREVAA